MIIPEDYNDVKSLAFDNGYEGKSLKKDDLVKFLEGLSEVETETEAEEEVETETETEAEEGGKNITLLKDVMFKSGLAKKNSKITLNADQLSKMPKTWYK